MAVYQNLNYFTCFRSLIFSQKYQKYPPQGNPYIIGKDLSGMSPGYGSHTMGCINRPNDNEIIMRTQLNPYYKQITPEQRELFAKRYERIYQ